MLMMRGGAIAMQISVNETAARTGRNTVDVLPTRTDSARVSQGEAAVNSEKSNRQQEAKELTKEMVRALAEAGNTIAEAFKIEIRFETHEETNLQKMTIVDPDTGAVIREIPPEAILDMIGKMWERIGIIIDKKI